MPALTTGMRQGEILGLRLKDVCFDSGIICINQTLSHDGKTILTGAKTQASLRKIEMSPKLMIQLKSHKLGKERQKKALGSEYKDFDLVVSTSNGTPLNPANVRRTFNRLIKAADVPKIRFHDLRHTHATALLSKEVNVKVISERLGHSNIKVTLDTYSHVLPTMQKDAILKVDLIIQ